MMQPRTLYATALSLLAASCPAKHDDAESATAITLRALATGLEEQHARSGAWPGSIDQVCSRDDCPGFPPNAQLLDAWDRAITYVRTERSYLLRSLGRDGRSGTPDDLTVSPEIEDARLRAFAGCYQVTSSGADVPTHVELTTTLAAPRSSFYEADTGQWGADAWLPLTDDTVQIMRFDSQHSTTVIRLGKGPAGLSGWRFRRGIAPVEVLATRVTCRTSGDEEA